MGKTAEQQSLLPPSYSPPVNPAFRAGPSAPLLTTSYSTTSPSMTAFKQISGKNPNIKKLAESARKELFARALEQQKFQVAFIMDVSGSMADLYNNGCITELAEYLLSIAAFLDDNQEIEVFPFGNQSTSEPIKISAEEDHQTLHAKLLACFNNQAAYGRGTNYKAGLQASRLYYQEKNRQAQNNPEEKPLPVLRFILTDGENGLDLKEFYTEALEASGAPIIDKYMVISDKKNLDNFTALNWVDNSSVIGDTRKAYENVPREWRRLYDNADVKHILLDDSGTKLKSNAINFHILLDEILEALICISRIGMLPEECINYNPKRAEEFLNKQKKSGGVKDELLHIDAGQFAPVAIEEEYKRRQTIDLTQEALASYNEEYIKVHDEPRSGCCVIL